jgi:hypothetical protein
MSDQQSIADALMSWKLWRLWPMARHSPRSFEWRLNPRHETGKVPKTGWQLRVEGNILMRALFHPSRPSRLALDPCLQRLLFHLPHQRRHSIVAAMSSALRSSSVFSIASAPMACGVPTTATFPVDAAYIRQGAPPLSSSLLHPLTRCACSLRCSATGSWLRLPSKACRESDALS